MARSKLGDDLFIKSYGTRYRPMREFSHKWNRGISIHNASYRKWRITDISDDICEIHRVEGWYPMVKVQQEYVRQDSAGINGFKQRCSLPHRFRDATV